MNETATVYLYPPSSIETHQPGIEYPKAHSIVTRQVPVSAIEFLTKKGQRVTSTLPYIILWDKP